MASQPECDHSCYASRLSLSRAVLSLSNEQNVHLGWRWREAEEGEDDDDDDNNNQCSRRRRFHVATQQGAANSNRRARTEAAAVVSHGGRFAERHICGDWSHRRYASYRAGWRRERRRRCRNAGMWCCIRLESSRDFGGKGLSS